METSQLVKTLTFAVVASLVVLLPATSTASNDPPSGTFDNCPVTGEGTHGAPPRDADLNTLKNRSTQEDPHPYQVAELLDKLPKPSDDELRKPRNEWTHDDRAVVLPYEQSEAQIVGYLYDAKAEGPEQPNCGAPVPDGDYHIWLMDDASQDRSESAVVEVTPRWRDVNPAWEVAELKSIARDKERVRITGWLLFDQEHPEQLDKTRGTLWELHPITKIEIYKGGSWQELSSDQGQ